MPSQGFNAPSQGFHVPSQVQLDFAPLAGRDPGLRKVRLPEGAALQCGGALQRFA